METDKLYPVPLCAAVFMSADIFAALTHIVLNLFSAWYTRHGRSVHELQLIFTSEASLPQVTPHHRLSVLLSAAPWMSGRYTLCVVWTNQRRTAVLSMCCLSSAAVTLSILKLLTVQSTAPRRLNGEQIHPDNRKLFYFDLNNTYHHMGDVLWRQQEWKINTN